MWQETVAILSLCRHKSVMSAWLEDCRICNKYERQKKWKKYKVIDNITESSVLK